MTQPLVDNEGFPRSDIDVYQVRTTRHKIICKYLVVPIIILENNTNSLSLIKGLQNDLKNLTKQIENALHDLHAQQREGLGLTDNSTSFLKEFEEETIPFAKIGTVSDGSPAGKAVRNSHKNINELFT